VLGLQVCTTTPGKMFYAWGWVGASQPFSIANPRLPFSKRTAKVENLTVWQALAGCIWWATFCFLKLLRNKWI
jgi:hypothetical protein